MTAPMRARVRRTRYGLWTFALYLRNVPVSHGMLFADWATAPGSCTKGTVHRIPLEVAMTSCTDNPWYECRNCSYSTSTPNDADAHEQETGHIVVEISHADWENW